MLPAYAKEHTFRVYFRYKTTEQCNLLNFSKVCEQYSSDDYNYIVGEVTIANLKAHQEELRHPDSFVAAYPFD